MMYTMPKNLLSICVNFTLATQQNFLYILQAGENSHRSSVCDCITFLFRFTADLSPQQVRRSILSCGSSHTVQPKIVQLKRASFMYVWSFILSAACLAI